MRSRTLNVIKKIFKCKTHEKAILILVTNGGSPDAAYKITRYLQDKYEHLSVLVSGMCKSAGTLMALGADELVFTPYGELGPLDIQISKVDRFDAPESGLSIQDALNTLEARAKITFYEMTKDYMQANNGLLSFATASKAAVDFTTQLYAPIFSRIDPEEVGSRVRSMRIAQEYGRRLAIKSENPQPDTLNKLAETYPSHSFVIDHLEASTLFKRVRPANSEEKALVEALGVLARAQQGDHSAYTFHTLSELTQESEIKAHAQADRRRSASKNGEGSSKSTEPSPAPPKRSGRRTAQSVSQRAKSRANGAVGAPSGERR